MLCFFGFLFFFDLFDHGVIDWLNCSILFLSSYSISCVGFAWVYAYISKGVFCLYDLRYDWRGPLGFSICGLTDLFVCLSFFF